jgi:hypothetical protein
MSLVLLFHHLPLNMFRMLVHQSSGVCDLLWIYFMCYIALVRCVLVLWCGSAGVVWYPEQYNTWNKSTIIRKLLKMDVLTFETCWAVNSEIIKQVTSSWSIFIQLSRYQPIIWQTFLCYQKYIRSTWRTTGRNRVRQPATHTGLCAFHLSGLCHSNDYMPSPPPQCHHMSLWTSWSSLLGMAAV